MEYILTDYRFNWETYSAIWIGITTKGMSISEIIKDSLLSSARAKLIVLSTKKYKIFINEWKNIKNHHNISTKYQCQAIPSNAKWWMDVKWNFSWYSKWISRKAYLIVNMQYISPCCYKESRFMATIRNIRNLKEFQGPEKKIELYI